MGCSDYELGLQGDASDGWGDTPTDGAAQIQVLPDPFDFGTLATACNDGSFPFTIRNLGNVDLEVLSLDLSGGDPSLVLEVSAAPFTLQPGEWIQGLASWTPLSDGETAATFTVESTDRLAPFVARPFSGVSCGDMDTDGICDDDDSDRDGDGIEDTVDEFPDYHVIDDVLIDFDDLSPGTRVTDQYSSLGITLEGSGAPGEGGDSNVVAAGSEHTTAPLHTPSNVLSTWVNDGFNYDGAPGLSGWLDSAAHVVTMRLYTAGIEYAEASGGEQDQGTITSLDASGETIGSSTVSVDTNAGIESSEIEIMGGEIRGFELYTGDFDALDDLRILRLEAPECGEPLP
jgi:hypothetical protein